MQGWHAEARHLLDKPTSVDVLRWRLLLLNCRRVGIPHSAQPNGENDAPKSKQNQGEDASLHTKTTAGQQWVAVKAGSEQMAVGLETAVRCAIEVNLAPGPCRVDSQRHPQVPRSAQNQNGHQAITGCKHRPQAMTAGIEIVHPAHEQG